MLFGMELVLKARDPGMKLMIIADNLGEAVGDTNIFSSVSNSPVLIGVITVGNSTLEVGTSY